MRFWPKRTNTAALQQSAKDVLAPLPEPFRSSLVSMYAGELQRGSDDKLYPLDSITRIAPEQGMWLYETCRKLKTTQTAEVGLAYGFSTIFFLAAIRENAGGLHTAIDPFEEDCWHGIGRCQAVKVATTHAFRFLSERSAVALGELGRNDERFDLIFIDGGHCFDSVLVDFTLSAELSPPGGYIVLDDMWLPSVRKAVSFIRNNRADFAGVVTPISNIAVFRRVGDDTREWKHYVDF
ncbi:MAG: class I SAM-dependent methyltransferase [Acidobacteriota bacterium]